MESTLQVPARVIVNTLIDLIAGPFQYEFMVRALIVSILVGIVCPLIGGYIITRGLAFMGDALAHGVMPGLVVGFMLGFSPLVAAVPTAIGFALLIGFVSRRTGLGEDTTIGILFAGMFALGLMMLSVADNITVNIEDILLGQVLGVSQADTIITAGLAVLVVLCLAALHRPLIFTSFDPLGAKVVGIPTGFMDYLLLALLALVIVLSVQAVGVVMVLAMLVIPAATAYLLARRFTSIMIIGAWLGTLAAVTGLYLSYYFNLPSGPSMSLVSTGFFGLAAVSKRRLIA